MNRVNIFCESATYTFYWFGNRHKSSDIRCRLDIIAARSNS